ncbi:MAG: class I tRNA ligase family protein [Anaerolineales bacterium]|nr:class I tRNA ligase family protein [Anaerolineales bacterium]
MHVNDVTQPIFENLTEKNLAYRLEDYTHRYPVCWRCNEELVFRLVDEWFISMGEQLGKAYEQVTEKEKVRNLRYQIMEVVVNETHWYPSFGYERELDWLRNMHDWMISKKRYWGLTLPIWECASCGNFEVIGSKEELRARAVSGWDVFEGHSPHRPYIDAVEIECNRCGERVKRIPDVGNPWLDAGVVGMSTLSYNSDRSYWEKWFPADWISESFPGQFRNWFYSLLAMSTILERRAPFKHVFTYGTLLAEDGRAMHKSWGNAIEFNEAADRMGVDVMRWLYSNQRPERDLLFGYHRADEVRRQFLIPLWNVYSFFVTYANIDGWLPDKKQALSKSDLDRWILSRLNQLVAHVTSHLEVYEPDVASNAVNQFLDDLSNWYLRRSRRRFWVKAGASEDSDADKNSAYTTLYQVLVTLSRLLAPFVPFVTEAMHQNLVRSVDPMAPESVHHCDWPEVEDDAIDEELSADMALVMRLVSLGHAARNQANQKLRQPLEEAAFFVGSKREAEAIRRHAELLREELNVKNIRLLDAVTEAATFRLRPLPKQLGQKYGAQFPAIRKAIQNLDAVRRDEIASQLLLKGSSFQVVVEGEKVEILPDEVEVQIDAHEGYSAVAEGAYVTALVMELTPELELEGLAREFVRRVQDLRKQASLQVDSQIHIEFLASSRLEAAIEEHRDYIVGETLGRSLTKSERPTGAASEKHEFDGEELTVAILESEV